MCKCIFQCISTPGNPYTPVILGSLVDLPMASLLLCDVPKIVSTTLESATTEGWILAGVASERISPAAKAPQHLRQACWPFGGWPLEHGLARRFCWRGSHFALCLARLGRLLLCNCLFGIRPRLQLVECGFFKAFQCILLLLSHRGRLWLRHEVHRNWQGCRRLGLHRHSHRRLGLQRQSRRRSSWESWQTWQRRQSGLECWLSSLKGLGRRWCCLAGSCTWLGD